MGDRGAPPIAQLTKHHVEQLLAAYDGDPVSSLTDALRVALGAPEAAFDELVALADLDKERRARLQARDVAALDELAAELNETRRLARRR